MTEPMLDLCPLCGRRPDDVGWFDEQEQFLVDTCARPATTMTARSPRNRGCGWPPKGDLYFSADFGTVFP